MDYLEPFSFKYVIIIQTVDDLKWWWTYEIYCPENISSNAFQYVGWHYSVVQYNKIWDQSRYAPSQLETLLHCNDICHWLGAYLDWSLQDIAYTTAIIQKLHKLESVLTNDTPFLALTGELWWGVCCENFLENWPHHNGTALYNF